MKMERAARRAAAEHLDSERPKLTYLIGRLDRAVRRRINDELNPLEISLAQYTVMSVLSARGELSNAKLASRSLVTPQAMNEVVRALEAKKLVTRRADPAHGRIVHLQLTARGQALLHQCDLRVSRLEQQMLAGFGNAEREAMRAALTACVHTLETQPARKSANDSN